MVTRPRGARHVTALASVCAVLLTAGPRPALAEEAPGPAATPAAPPSAERIGGRHRILAGHRFEPSSLVDDPFSSSSFGLHAQLSYGTARSQKITGTPPHLTLGCCQELDYAGIMQEVEGSVRLADWFTLRAKIGTLTYSGLSRDSVLVVGSGIKMGGELQAVSGIDLGEHFRGSLVLGASAQPGLDILVASGVLDAYEQGSLDSLDVTLTSRPVIFGAGTSLAWAPAPNVGVMAEVQLLVPQKSGAGTFASNGLSAAVAADLGLGRHPIGVTAAYRIITPLESNEFRTQQDLRAGVYYSRGPAGLSMRGELGVTWIALRQDLPSRAGTLDLSLRYDW